MTGSRIALDTNVASLLMADDAQAVRILRSFEEVALPVVVLGELYFGAAKSARGTENHVRIVRLLLFCPVIGIDADSARCYARVRPRLRQIGKPIPPNDMWIAALCIQHELSIVTRDAHFEHVESLDVRTWQA